MPAVMEDAVLLVDKPAGKTSHDVVAGVRRELRARLGHRPKVGHAGTLDPFATGLLIVLTGRATRAQRWFMHAEKAYETTARFGWVSSTGDPEGELTETGVLPPEPLVLPTGRLTQRPPAYSAIKVDGERLYAKARRGEVVDVPEREVDVHEFTRLAPDRFRIRCSSGTYVRSLIADLGDAYCTELRRTAIGPFRVEDCAPGEPVAIGLGAALERVLPVLALDEDAARDAVHGRPVRAPVEGEVLLRDAAGPIAIGHGEGDRVRVLVGFRG